MSKKYKLKFLVIGTISENERTREEWRRLEDEANNGLPKHLHDISVFDVHGNYIGKDYKDGTPLTRIVETE